MAIGGHVVTRTALAPQPDEAALTEFKAKAEAPAPKYRTELLQPVS